MATIHDYLYWRGDIPLNACPLNENDGLVLTRFAYMPFEDIPFGEYETVGTLCEKLKMLPEDRLRLSNDLQLIHQLSESPRYSDLRVTDFIKDNNEDAVKQFAAITVHLSEEEMYLSYCGTDSTLLGWKEDFYMSFMEDVPAQVAALEYAKARIANYPGKVVYIGGHSKGGNLAVYTAVNLPEKLKDRLIHVSNYDGPGFPASYIESHPFNAVKDRIDTFLPQESMIGRIHEHAEGFHVVESTESGISQHNIYSWLVEPHNQVPVSEPDESSEIMYTAIQNVLQNTSPEQRKNYIDRTYDLLVSNDVTTMKEVFNDLPKSVNAYVKTASELPEEERKEQREVGAAMLKSYLEAVREVQGQKISDSVNIPSPEEMLNNAKELLYRTFHHEEGGEDAQPEETFLNEDA